jgi:polysaccharide pyruvyl transferase WcaK-like protein
MKQFLVIGGANAGMNLGDDAMFEAITDVIKKNYNAYIISDSEDPNWTHENVNEILPHANTKIKIRFIGTILAYLRYLLTPLFVYVYNNLGIKSFSPIINQYMITIKDCDAVIISGMGALNDRFSSHGIYRCAQVIKIATSMNKPVIITGNGIGPINRYINKLVLLYAIKDVNRVYVRDRVDSKKELQKIGYKGKIIETVDDSFFLELNHDNISFAEKILKEYGLKKGRFVILNIHEWDNKLTEKDFEKIKLSITKLRGYNVFLLPNYFQKGKDDRIILKKLHKYFNNKNIILLDKKITAKQSSAICSMAKFSIATRYHTGVFSLNNNIPTILLCLDNDYYVQKMLGVLNYYDLEEFAVKYDNIGLLYDKISLLLKDYPIIKNKILRGNNKIRKKGFESMQYLKSVVK